MPHEEDELPLRDLDIDLGQGRRFVSEVDLADVLHGYHGGLLHPYTTTPSR
jgi:hypothetical protein